MSDSQAVAERPADPKAPKPELVIGDHATPIIPRNIEEVFRVAQAVVTANLAPDSYTRERGQDLPAAEIVSRVVIGIMKGAEVGFPPITALSTIALVNKRPCIWGEGAVALIQSKGVLESMDIEYFGAKPDNEVATGGFSVDYGCRVTMRRRGQDKAYVGEFTVGDAKRAHLWMNPKRTPWLEHPKRMMKWRAFSFASKDGFSDCLMGLEIREILEDLPPEPVKQINSDFLDDAPKPATPAQSAIAAPTEAPMADLITPGKVAEPVGAAGDAAPAGPAQAAPAEPTDWTGWVDSIRGDIQICNVPADFTVLNDAIAKTMAEAPPVIMGQVNRLINDRKKQLKLK